MLRQIHNTTVLMDVKITSPFKLGLDQRRIQIGLSADGQILAVAQPAGRQDGEHVYSATVAVIESNVGQIVATAPNYASLEVSRL